MNREASPTPAPRKARNTAILCALGVAAMIGMSYAAVPLYRMFCQATGFGGTTQRAQAAPDQVLARKITVRFEAGTAPGLPWQFYPEQRSAEVKVGEVGLAYYKAINTSGRPITGRAVYNVTPDKAGLYFVKIQCFCFSEQTLAPGQNVDMPVQFYVDPAIVKDSKLDEVRTITLSYTFFEAARPNRVSRGDTGSDAGASGG